MRIARFSAGIDSVYGLLEEPGTLRSLSGTPYEGPELDGRRFSLSEVELLAPCEPSKIIGVGLNYRDHAEELGLGLPEEPMLFLKPSTAVIGPGQKILYPEMAGQVDYEGELAVVIGRRASRIARDRAAQYILGYTCFNDVTARDLQAKDIQFARSKGFDTFAPVGPWIETEIDPTCLEIETYVNGERRQASNTRQMIFDPFYLVYFISWIMTLNPGDIIASGTPGGIGPVHPGDRIEVRIPSIGVLVNEVASRQGGAWVP